MLKKMKLRTKLLFAGCLLTLIPLLIMSAIVYRQNQEMIRVAEEKSLQLAHDDFRHIIERGVFVSSKHFQQDTELICL